MTHFKQLLIQSIDAAARGEHEASLHLIFACVSRLAKETFPREKKDGVRTRAYLKSRQYCIVGISTLGGIMANRGSTILIGDKSFEYILHEKIRCTLTHEAKVDDFFKMHSEASINFHNNTLTVPRSFPLSLIIAAISDEKSIDLIDGKIGRTLIGKCKYGGELNLDKLVGVGDVAFDESIEFVRGLYS
jgi:hypothetical protein